MAKLSFDLAAATAAFAARGGQVSKVPTGARVRSEYEMRRLSGWEPDSLNKYYVLLLGEDGMEWAEEIFAESKPAAIRKVNAAWPESRIQIIRQI